MNSALSIPEQSVALCKPKTVDLPDGSKATIEFEPEQSGSTFYVPTIAASKIRDTSYSITFDGGEEEYVGAIPPTDIDDLAAVWTPPKEFDNSCTVVMKNLGSNPQTYHVQLIGWEVPDES